MDAIKKNLISHIKNTFDGIQNETQSFQQILSQIVRDEEQNKDKTKKLFLSLNSNRLPIDLNYLRLNLDLITKNINALGIEFNKKNIEYMSESILNMLDSKLNILIYDANLIKKESENLKTLIEFRKNIDSNVINPNEDQVKRNINLKQNSFENVKSNYSEILNKLKIFNYDIEIIIQTYFYYFNEIESPVIINLKNRTDELSKSLEANLKYNYKEMQSNLANIFSDLESKFNYLNQKQNTLDKSYIELKESFIKIQNEIDHYDLTLDKAISEKQEKIDKNLLIIENEINLEFKKLSDNLSNETDKIKKTHKDFLTLVEKSGVYELTQNYKLKAEEENTEYKTIETTQLILF